MLNDPSSVEAARAFAERTLRESRGETDRDLSRMFVEALSRPASDKELSILRQLVLSQTDYYRQRPQEVEKLLKVGLHPADDTLDPVELAAFTAVARTIFNMHEFITRN